MITAKRLAILLAGSLALLAGCGPKYPNCENDEHCKAKNEVCVQGLCKACRDDSQCGKSDACRICNTSNTCTRRNNCCTSDADCPGGRCWNVAGRDYGECGAQCDANHPCPPGMRCNAQGMCEPDAECGPSAPCPPGQICQNGRCIAQCTLSPVYFDYNEDRIKLSEQSKLNANGDCIKGRGGSVMISGHCDERGTEEYNLALGERRATSSKGYLQNLGVSGGSMRTISYGEERPVCNSSNESCWEQNRRAEFSFE